MYVKAKITKFFSFGMKIMEIYEFLLILSMKIIASLLLCVNIVCCESIKAIEENLGCDVNYNEKLKH